MPATYEPIATQTLGTAAASITFSSIPATYTDLRLVFQSINSTARDLLLQFNNDTATNYSVTTLGGNGTAAVSARATAATSLDFNIAAGNLDTVQPSFYQLDVFSYAGATNKTILCNANNDFNGAGGVSNTVGLWRSTSAITSVKFLVNLGTFNIGATATLFGIKAA